MRPPHDPPLLMHELPPDADPVAVLAREAGRRAAEQTKARLREKARRRAARQAKAAHGETAAPKMPPASAPAPEVAAAGPAQATAREPAPRPTGQDSRRRRSSRSAARRTRRRLRAGLAAGVLGALSVWAVSGLYQMVGRAPLPTDTWTLAQADRPAAALTPMPATPPARPAVATPAPPPAAPAPVATAPHSPTTSPSPPAAGPAPPRVTGAGRGAAAVLPYLPGSQVVESDAEPQQAPGGGTTWAATLSSAEALDKIAAYYRQQLNAQARPGGATLTEVTPGPGQLLLSLGNPTEGSHSAVWIGAVDGQTLIRLMRTQGPTAPQ